MLNYGKVNKTLAYANFSTTNKLSLKIPKKITTFSYKRMRPSKNYNWIEILKSLI